MKANLLLDTNIVIYFLEGRRHVVDLIQGESLFISFITEIELLSWNNLSSQDENLILKFISSCQILEYTVALKHTVIEFRKQYNLRLADSIIAATVHQQNMNLMSADSSFNKIEEIDFFLIKP